MSFVRIRSVSSCRILYVPFDPLVDHVLTLKETVARLEATSGGTDDIQLTMVQMPTGLVKLDDGMRLSDCKIDSGQLLFLSLRTGAGEGEYEVVPPELIDGKGTYMPAI